nr:unnamed protein product [Haemonchus contortus]
MLGVLQMMGNLASSSAFPLVASWQRSAGSTRKEYWIINLGGTVIGARKHECTIGDESSFFDGSVVTRSKRGLEVDSFDFPVVRRSKRGSEVDTVSNWTDPFSRFIEGPTTPSDLLHFYYTSIQSGIRGRSWSRSNKSRKVFAISTWCREEKKEYDRTLLTGPPTDKPPEILVAVSTAQHQAVAYPFMSDPIRDRG